MKLRHSILRVNAQISLEEFPAILRPEKLLDRGRGHLAILQSSEQREITF